jgi:hypothetical protein
VISLFVSEVLEHKQLLIEVPHPFDVGHSVLLFPLLTPFDPS